MTTKVAVGEIYLWLWAADHSGHNRISRNDGEVEGMIIGVGNDQFYPDVWDGGSEFPGSFGRPCPYPEAGTGFFVDCRVEIPGVIVGELE
jgi:hypothetical protein